MQRLKNLNSCMKSATLSQCKRKFGTISHWQLINKFRMNCLNQAIQLRSGWRPDNNTIVKK